MTKTTTDWALARILELDIIEPGMAGAFLRASAERRQVTAAFLAGAKHLKRSNQEAVRLIAEGTHDQILQAAYEDVPTGFRSALGRSGSAIHAPRYYRYLSLVLRDATSRNVVNQLVAMTPIRLRILRILPPPLRSARLVELHRDAAHARQTASLYRLLVLNGIEPEALQTALRQVATAKQLVDCWRRWSSKLELPEHPVPACALYEPVRNGVELRRLALRYQNCARRYLPGALEGEDAFATFTSELGQAVIHLCQKEGRWWLRDAFGKRNAETSGALEAQIVQHLAQHGVGRLEQRGKKPGKWDSLRSVIDRWDYGHDEDRW